ncbi:MAG: ABC transporter ATP-binding protein/permease [Holosporales bacterium]|jgi:ABC-type multidrug transport system fused ATPase/permease subunit|nr:ABC transporter ATP-binding protein/permease [Holosporales bacterium]
MKQCPIIAYLFSLLIIPIGMFGIFYRYFIESTDESLSFYVKASSLLILAISFLLLWYYSSVFIRKKVLEKLKNFSHDVINTDSNRVSTARVSEITKDTLTKLRSYEKQNFSFLGLVIPLLLAFITTVSMGIAIAPSSAFAYTSSCALLTIMTKVLNKIICACDVRAYKNYFISYVKKIIIASKGIQFYDSEEFVIKKLDEKERLILQKTTGDITKTIWKSFFSVFLLFLIACFLYLIKLDYLKLSLFDVPMIAPIYLTSIFIYIAFLISLFRCAKIRDMKIADIYKYRTHETDCPNEKPIDEKSLFITFHGVSFQDPTKLSDTPILNNVSFSILPGESVSIIGKNSEDASYIFELILKYYNLQSGKIYISGTSINNISKITIRSLIGIFKEDFALIDGTVRENIKLTTQDEEKMIKISEKTDLLEELDLPMFDKHENIALPQESLFRLQITRILIQDPKIILINTPAFFESDDSKNLFYDFVDYCSKQKTMLIITSNPKTIIYSDKILYLDSSESLFGTHAELSKNKKYQTYMKEI